MKANMMQTLPAVMPAIFIGHGSPMNAITENPYRTAWQAVGHRLPRPQAILCISAHWQTAQPQVCNAPLPQTIHDFGGFPAELFAQQYPAPGAPELAERITDLLQSRGMTATAQWGLDHGAWSVLQSLFPNADVPVLQLSLATQYGPAQHLSMAQDLACLRAEGVLIVCSGNITHNLSRLNQGAANNTPDWATSFDDYIAKALRDGDDDSLVRYVQQGNGHAQAVPTDEHYLPAIYAAGMRLSGERVEFLVEGFDLGSLSMRSFAYGMPDRRTHGKPPL